MTDQEKRSKAADIGDEALDFGVGPDREAFIEKNCEGDSGLAQYVLHYLAGFKQILPTRDQPPRSHAARRKDHPGQNAPSKPSESNPPQQILNGRYKLTRLLGKGGMGKVFEALDMETGQPVAIKAIRSDYASGEDERMRFVREARAVSRLSHPNIVGVYDIDQNKGALYIVMELVKGAPLTHFVAAQSHISLKSKLFIVAQVAEALGYAHTQGIIHRDIKPLNIVILRDQSVKVLDFGIAEQVDLPNTLVEGVGTIPYMSPEQLRKQSLDARSDIWSTGITLFQFLTGNLPYRTVQEILSAPPPQLPPEFPSSRELNIVLARALAKDRQMRYPNANELAADLRELQQTSEIATPPVNAARFVESRASGENYVLPDLNFSIPVKGELTSREGRLNKWDECKKKMTDHIGLPLVLFFVVPILWSAFLFTSKPGRVTAAATLRPVLTQFTDWGVAGTIPTTSRAVAGTDSTSFNNAGLPGVGMMQDPIEYGSMTHHTNLDTYERIIPDDVKKDVQFNTKTDSTLVDRRANDPFQYSVAAGVVLLVSLAICFIFFWAMERLARCRACRQPMMRTAHWTRLVKSKQEVSFGYRDCMAALKNGLWEDAAKLLTIHGAKYASEDASRFVTPARYHLHFFECGLCGHHAARLTTDEMIEGRWEQQPNSAEVYWGDVAAKPLLLSSLAATPKAYYRVLPDFIDNLHINRVVISGVIIAVCLSLTLGLIAAAYQWRRENQGALQVEVRKPLSRATALLNKPMIGKEPEQALAFMAQGMRLTTANSRSMDDPDLQIYNSWITLSLASRAWPLPKDMIFRFSHLSSPAADFRLEHHGEVNSAAFSPDGLLILTSSADHTARLWSTNTHNPIGSPLGHTDAVTSATFSSDGLRVVTTSADRTARIWDVQTSHPVGPPLKHNTAVLSAAFSPDGHRIVTASADRTTRVWDTATFKQIGPALQHDRMVNVTAALFGRDGGWVVTDSNRSTATIFTDLNTGKSTGPELGGGSPIHSAAFSPDGKYIIMTALLDNTARLWDAATGKSIGRPLRHNSPIQFVAFSPDGRRCVSIATDQMLRIWDAETGSAVGRDFEQGGTSSSFSPDSRRIVTALRRSTQVVDAETGDPIGPALFDEDFVNSVAFSPDGRHILTAAGNFAHLWTVLEDLNSPQEAFDLADLAEVVGGYRTGDSDELVPLPMSYRKAKLLSLLGNSKLYH